MSALHSTIGSLNGQPFPYAEIAATTVRWQLERLVAEGRISEEALASVRSPETYLSENVRALVLRLVAHIPKRDGDPIQVPADWWQHFKLRWFPRWALRRWPVEYTKYQARAYYPELPARMPQSATGREYVVWVPEPAQITVGP